MKGNLQSCMKLTFGSEGGYVDHPRDPGGPTKFGITLKTLEAFRGRPVGAEDVRKLRIEEAAEILERQYWRKVWGDDLPAGVDYSMFDFAVNSGPAQAIKTAQKLLGVDRDGSMGALTLQAIRQMSSAVFISRYNDARLDFLERLNGWPTFGKGWKGRVNHVKKASLAMIDKPAPTVAEKAKPEVLLPEETAKAPPSDTPTVATPQGKASAGGLLAALATALSTLVATLTPYADVSYVKHILIGVAVLGAVGTIIGLLVSFLLQRRHIANGNAL